MENKLTKCKACGAEIAIGVNKCIHCGKDQRSFFGQHKIITVILVLVVIGVIGRAMGSSSSGSSTTAATNNSVVVDPIKVTASKLLKDYDENEVKADKEYKGKLVTISGFVDSVNVMLGKTFVNINSGGEYEIISLQCYLKDQTQIDKSAELKKGQKVVVTGVVSGKSINIGVDDCIIE